MLQTGAARIQNYLNKLRDHYDFKSDSQTPSMEEILRSFSTDQGAYDQAMNNIDRSKPFLTYILSLFSVIEGEQPWHKEEKIKTILTTLCLFQAKSADVSNQITTRIRGTLEALDPSSQEKYITTLPSILEILLYSKDEPREDILNYFEQLCLRPSFDSYYIREMMKIIPHLPATVSDSRVLNQHLRLIEGIGGLDTIATLNQVFMDLIVREGLSVDSLTQRLDRALERLNVGRRTAAGQIEVGTALALDHPHRLGYAVQLLQTPLDRPLPEVPALVGPAIAGQEHIYAVKEAMVSTYEQMMRAKPELRALIPPSSATDAAFNRVTDELREIFNEGMKLKEPRRGTQTAADTQRLTKIEKERAFRYHTALRTLTMLKGLRDERGNLIETFYNISHSAYLNYNFEGLPRTQDLFVLAYQLMSLDEKAQKQFLWDWLLKKMSVASLWNSFKSTLNPAHAAGHVATYATIAEALAADKTKGNLFFDALYHLFKGQSDKMDFVAMPPDFLRYVDRLKKDYLFAVIDKLTPLVEGLFMTMRGHNTELLNPTEANKPACPFGNYANILKAITEAFEIEEGSAATTMVGIEIVDCMGTILTAPGARKGFNLLPTDEERPTRAEEAGAGAGAGSRE